MPSPILTVEGGPLITLDLQTIPQDVGRMVVGIFAGLESALVIAAVNPPIDLAIMDVDLAATPDSVEVARRLCGEHDFASHSFSARLIGETRARASERTPVSPGGKPPRKINTLCAIL